MIDAGELKKGIAIELDGGIYQIVEYYYEGTSFTRDDSFSRRLLQVDRVRIMGILKDILRDEPDWEDFDEFDDYEDYDLNEDENRFIHYGQSDYCIR